MDIIPKTIGNRQRDVREVALGEYTPPQKICRSKSTNQEGVRSAHRSDLCFSICRFSQVVFIPQAQPHAQSLFLFPIVFGINLVHFFVFDFFLGRKKNGAAGNSIVCFAASIPCQSRHLTVRRMRTVSKGATFFATESVNPALFKRGETDVQIFWQGKAQNSSPILRCTFLARKSVKLIANFSAKMVTSLPSLFLSLSVSLSLSLSHRVYLMHNIGSAEALPGRERERDRRK